MGKRNLGSNPFGCNVLWLCKPWNCCSANGPEILAQTCDRTRWAKFLGGLQTMRSSSDLVYMSRGFRGMLCVNCSFWYVVSHMKWMLGTCLYRIFRIFVRFFISHVTTSERFYLPSLWPVVSFYIMCWEEIFMCVP